MKPSNECLKSFEAFADGLKKPCRTGILFHSDADGVSAAAIAFKAVERLSGQKPAAVLMPPLHEFSISGKTISFFRERGVEKLIVLDLSADWFPESVKEAEKFFKLLVLDHHQIKNNISSDKTIFIKSQMVSGIEPSRYPASKLCFDLFSRVTDLSDVDWLPVIGIYGDVSAAQWKPFIAEVEKKHSFKGFREIVDLIESLSAVDYLKLYDALELLATASSPQRLLRSKLSSFKARVDKEVEKWLRLFPLKAEFFSGEKVIFFKAESEYSVKSILANRLSLDSYPSHTLIVAQDDGSGFLALSARRQDGQVNVSQLLEKATSPFKGAAGGGHLFAAGGRVRAEDFEKFKKRVLGLLSGHRTPSVSPLKNSA